MGWQEAIAAASACAPLVLLLGTDDEMAHMYASRALASLSRDHGANIVTITQLLIPLLSRGAPTAQQRAASVLWTLVRENPSAHTAVARAAEVVARAPTTHPGVRAWMRRPPARRTTGG